MDCRKRNYMVYGCMGLVVFTILYYRMLNGVIPSDYNQHLQSSLAGIGYSFNSILFRLLYMFDSSIFIATIFALVTIATPFALTKMMKEVNRLSGKSNSIYLSTVSVMITTASALVVPLFYNFFYYGQLAMNPWHNDTYTSMRLFSIMALVYYFKIQDRIKYSQTVNYLDYIKLTIFLFLSSWSKPSFVLGFFPVMAVYLIIDVFRNLRNLRNHNKKSIIQTIILGLTAIPGGSMVLWQNYIVYLNDSTGNDITLGLSPAYLETGNPYLKIILFLLIPGLVLLYNRKDFFKDRIAVQLWLLWVVELLYFMFLYESGGRMMHGNLGWGTLIGDFFLFAYSILVYVNNFKDIVTKKLSDWKVREYIYFIGVGGLFLCQVATGIIWFVWILTGHSYYC